MNKPINPNIVIPESFAANGVKADFDSNKILNGFDRIQPDVLAGDNLNKFIDDTYKGLNYGIKGVDYLEERWKSQITNCLLEVPQRIKYTLENGTLTIKAGSVIIVPYGTEDLISQYPVGSVFLNDNFKVYDTQFADGKFFVWAELVNDLVNFVEDLTANRERVGYIFMTDARLDGSLNSKSGTDFSGYTGVFYNTNTNYSYYYNNGVIDNTSMMCLPFMRIISGNNSKYGSIQQVFNGIGYIGSNVWVDKGVKGLIPNDKNGDGTYKNIEVTTSKLISKTIGNIQQTLVLTLLNENIYSDFTTDIVYNSQDNHIYKKGVIVNNLPFATIYAGEKISNFNPKQPFRAVDYSDKPEVSSWSMPSNEHIYLTLGASGASYTAPANGWFCIAGASSSTTGWVQFQNTSAVIGSMAWNTAANNGLKCFVPAKKGDTITAQYYNLKDATLRFIYAEGEV